MKGVSMIRLTSDEFFTHHVYPPIFMADFLAGLLPADLSAEMKCRWK
jgi:hypothetical protein